MRPLFAQLRLPDPVWTAGLWLVALILLADNYHDLWEIFHFDWYRVMQADMPDWLVCVRFVVSLTLRIFLLWAVAGVLARREPYRKFLLVLCWFNALTFFLHHRYPSFIYISHYLNTNAEDFLLTANWFGHSVYVGAVARMFNAWVTEILPAMIGIIYLMNPSVKRLFK
jgi:hypothetical protein